ncbi:hypothetical protein [Candidatus Uabimicrobium sp. HlEnr_7]|uniref:tetratricopeptide repeat protein n=1 Tax=Candidatus Uabimicrobium helgolandensis TaxID=3095367 RepID=UPI003557955B
MVSYYCHLCKQLLNAQMIGIKQCPQCKNYLCPQCTKCPCATNSFSPQNNPQQTNTKRLRQTRHLNANNSKRRHPATTRRTQNSKNMASSTVRRTQRMEKAKLQKQKQQKVFMIGGGIAMCLVIIIVVVSLSGGQKIHRKKKTVVKTQQQPVKQQKRSKKPQQNPVVKNKPVKQVTIPPKKRYPKAKFSDNSSRPIINGKINKTYIQKKITDLKNAKKLPKCVFVTPLVDENGEYSDLGSFLSIESNYLATFSPKKMVDFTFGRYLEFLIDWLSYKDNSLILPERTQQYFCADSVITGVISERNNGYHLTISFTSGEKREKLFAYTDTYKISSWIALETRKYLKLDPAIPATSPFSVDELKSLAKDYCHSLRCEGYSDSLLWRNWANKYPSNILIQDMYGFNLLRQQKFYAATPHYSKLYIKNKNNDYAKYSWMRRLSSTYKYDKALSLLFDLLQEDAGNIQLYDHLEYILQKYSAWEEMEKILTWYREQNFDYRALYRSGYFYVEYAWHARGSGWASTVSENGFRLFKKRLLLAHVYLEEAYQQCAYDWLISWRMLTVCKGIGMDLSEINKWFRRGEIANKYKVDLYYNKLEYIKPKWHGSVEMMFQFASETIDKYGLGSPQSLIMIGVHEELGEQHNFGEDYYKKPRVWESVQEILNAYLKKYPNKKLWRQKFINFSIINGKNDLAAQHYLHIEKQSNEPGIVASYSGKPEFFFALAKAYNKNNQRNFAIKSLGKALKKKPEAYKYQLICAQLLIKEKQIFQAKKRLEIIIQKCSDSNIVSEAKKALRKTTK